MAKYYLSAPVDEIELARSVQPAVAALGGSVPASDELRELAATRGMDHATMLLYQAILASPRNRPFIEALEKQPPESTATPAGEKLLIVPALFHGHYPEAGADAALAARIAANCGFEVERIPVKSVGTVTENAAIIDRHLRAERAERLWIFSVSKGSADFRAFLHRYPESPAIPRLRGWVNVCGLANGCQISAHNIATPLRELKYRAVCALFRVSFELMRELSPSHPLWREPLRLPAGARLFNFMAIPLPCHVQKSVMGRYRAISALGPNDGMVVCRDSILEPGPVYPVWGSDHFFRVPQVPAILYKLFRFLRSPALASAGGMAA
jgi:hypothetical protein